jgi:hypothetical protein
MGDIKGQGFIYFRVGVLWMMMIAFGCKKEIETNQKIKPPVRSYTVTARIDKKGTNTDSEGKAVMMGVYSEETKLLSYRLEYEKIIPEQITLRSGAKGSKGTLVKELYVKSRDGLSKSLTGELSLTPLEERNLFKGYWFVVVNTSVSTPEISGVLTLKQN